LLNAAGCLRRQAGTGKDTANAELQFQEISPASPGCADAIVKLQENPHFARDPGRKPQVRQAR
jgi:hypothetical protein